MPAPSAPPPLLIDFIKNHGRFLVIGHAEPDGDCVASQLVFCSVLSRLGKEAIPCSAGPFKRSEVTKFENKFKKNIDDNMKSAPDGQSAAVIVVDCSTEGRIGNLEDQIRGLPIAIIDHHATGKLIDADVRYIDPNTPAAVLLIYALIKTLGENITADEAQLLFLGFCTDTGFFRHLDKNASYVFKIASEITAAGASPKTTFNAMTGGKSLNSRLLLSDIISRAESHFNGKLIFSREELNDKKRYGLESRDSDSLYQLLTSIDGVEAVAIVRQESEEKCTVGLRSCSDVNVAEIAATLGGGGHKNAAGLQMSGQIPEVRKKIIEEFKKILE